MSDDGGWDDGTTVGDDHGAGDHGFGDGCGDTHGGDTHGGDDQVWHADPGSDEHGPAAASGGEASGWHADSGATDHGTGEHGSTEDGVTDHGATDHGTGEHGSTEDGVTDHGSTDHGSTDHGSTDHGATDHGATDHVQGDLSAGGHDPSWHPDGATTDHGATDHVQGDPSAGGHDPGWHPDGATTDHGATDHGTSDHGVPESDPGDASGQDGIPLLVAHDPIGGVHDVPGEISAVASEGHDGSPGPTDPVRGETDQGSHGMGPDGDGDGAPWAEANTHGDAGATPPGAVEWAELDGDAGAAFRPGLLDDGGSWTGVDGGGELGHAEPWSDPVDQVEVAGHEIDARDALGGADPATGAGSVDAERSAPGPAGSPSEWAEHGAFMADLARFAVAAFGSPRAYADGPAERPSVPRAAVRAAIAGLVDQARGRIGIQTHRSSGRARTALGLAGGKFESAHILPQAIGSLVPDYAPGRALTVLLPQNVHRQFDAGWLREWERTKASGRPITASDVFKLIDTAVEATVDFPPAVKGTISWRLHQELYVELGLRPESVVWPFFVR